MALQIPVRSGPGARGEVRGKKEEVPAHLLVVLDRRQGEAGKLCGPKVELARGSRGSEKVWSGGFTAASSSPEFRWRQWCSGVSGRGFGEEARETD